MSSGKAPKRRRRRVKTLKTYIYKVLKQIIPLGSTDALGMSSQAMTAMNSLMSDLMADLAREGIALAKHNKKITVSEQCIKTAIRLHFQNELAKHGVAEASKAMKKVQERESGSVRKRSGLQFSVSRAKDCLEDCGAKRISVGAKVSLAAAVEYLAAEILELAGNAARDQKKKRITMRHIMMAIRNDEELTRLIPSNACTFAASGVKPNIEKVLLGKQK